MTHTKSSLTYTQAFRLYTGISVWNGIARMALAGIATYLLMIAMMRSSLSLGAFPVIVAGQMTVIRFLVTFGKINPGCKFFRTVKGGYATYVRSHITMHAEGFLSLLLIFAVIAILNLTGLRPIGNGLTVPAALSYVLLGRAAASFAIPIRNDAVRAAAVFAMYYLVSLLCVLAGHIVQFPLIACIVAVALTVLSECLFLRIYGKQQWNP